MNEKVALVDPVDTVTTTPEPESNVTRAVAPRAGPEEELVQTLHELDESGERYEVHEELGRGGMGEVHLCFDRRIGRLVARKRRAKGSAELKRFLREASVQGQLEHPTIVPLHDLAEGEDGELYFTMKAVRGQTLKLILAARRDRDAKMLADFPVRKLMKALANVCLGVAFAHSRGVIHRDLKPDNLMLGEFGEVYILDWGVAKLKAGGAAEDEALRVPLSGSVTKIGAMIGTVGYMSPEQCTGAAEIDERSDVYSLGAILFEILGGDALNGGSALEKVDATLAGTNVQERALLWPAEVRELAEVCERATTLDKESRLSSARELAEAIEQCLDPTVRRGRADLVSGVRTRDEARYARTIPPGQLNVATLPEFLPVQPPPVAAAPALAPERPRVTLAAGAVLVGVSLVRGIVAGDSLVWIGVQLFALVLLAVGAGPRRQPVAQP